MAFRALRGLVCVLSAFFYFYGLSARAQEIIEIEGPNAFSVSFLSDEVTLSIHQISNLSADSGSGHLVGQLWAAPSGTSCGGFSGYELAGTDIGYLDAGGSTPLSAFGLPLLNTPPIGDYSVLFLVVDDDYSATEACAEMGDLQVDSGGGGGGGGGGPGGGGTGGGGNSGGIELIGNYSYRVDFASSSVELTADEILNDSMVTSGTLQLSLWLTSSPYSGGTISGYELGAYTFSGSSNGTLNPQQYYSQVDVTVPLAVTPPDGTYYATLVVTEYDSSCGGYCIVDFGAFSQLAIVGTGAGGGGGASGKPVCTVSENPTSLSSVGGTVTLTSQCSGSPTAFAWSVNGSYISDNAPTIVYSVPANASPSAQTFTFSLVATNSIGASDQAYASITEAGADATNPTAFVGAQLSIGDNVTCEVTTNGVVRCWGTLVGGPNIHRFGATPTTVAGIPLPATSVAVGQNHACATLTDGSVWCWGFNFFGVLGNGSSPQSYSAPSQVLGMPFASTVVAGDAFTCALIVRGAVWCWGANTYGQLGNGGNDSPLGEPVQVVGLPSDATSIAASAERACALTLGGAVSCWGTGYLGGSIRFSPIAEPVEGLGSGISQISLSTTHSCALDSGGTVYCWGTNFSAIGSFIELPSRVALLSGIGATSISAGVAYTCVVERNGGVVACLGANDFGTLGDGTTVDNYTSLVLPQLPPLFAFSAVAAGYRTTCAIGTIGAYCWGTGVIGAGTGTGSAYGQLTPHYVLESGTNLNQHGITGPYAFPNANNQGVLVEVYPDALGPGRGLFAGGWFTFDTSASGGQRWYTLQGETDASSASTFVTIYETTDGLFANPQGAHTDEVGSAVITLNSCLEGTFSYQFADGRHATETFDRSIADVTCGQAGDNGDVPGSYLLAGAWEDPDFTGQGFFFDFNPIQNNFFGAWYTFASSGVTGSPDSHRWVTLQFPQSTVTPSTNIPIFASTGGIFDAEASVQTEQVGTATLDIQDCSHMTLMYSFSSGDFAGLAGSQNLVPVGPIPVGCHF